LREDLVAFGKFIAPGAFRLRSPDFHYRVGADLTNHFNRYVNLIAPRDHAKSTLVAVIGSLWHLVYGGSDTGRKLIVLSSKRQKLAKDHLKTIKGILDGSTNFRSLYGDLGYSVSPKWATDEIILPTRDVITTRGILQLIRGEQAEFQRITLAVGDDLEDENNTKTDTALENNLDWVYRQILPALAKSSDPRNAGRFWGIGTPICPGCIVERLSEDSRFLTRRFRALEDLDGGGYRALWPEQYSVDDLLAMRDHYQKDGKIYVFNREYQCIAVDGETQPFPPDNFRYWRGEFERYRGKSYLVAETSADLDEWGEEEVYPITTSLGGDPASSLERRACFTVCMPVHVVDGGRLFVDDYFKERVLPDRIVDVLAGQVQRFHPESVNIEPEGFQDLLRLDLGKELERLGIIPPLGLERKAKAVRSNKDRRLLGLQPKFARKLVHIRAGMRDFYDEFTMFPESKGRDIMDAFYWALRRTYEPMHAVVGLAELRGERGDAVKAGAELFKFWYERDEVSYDWETM